MITRVTRTLSCVALSLGIAVAFAGEAPAENRILRIHNRSGETIRNIYVSNVGAGVWEPDQIGRDTLEGNSYVDCYIDDGSGYCRFDFRFVLEDRIVETSYRYNVCTESDLYVVEPN